MEYLAVYNELDELLNEKIERKNKRQLSFGKYYRIVIIFIENSNQEYLIQKVSKQKGSVYATTGGHVQYNNSNVKTAQLELEEELGLKINQDELKLLKTYKFDKVYCDTYFLKKDIDIKTLKLQFEEVEEVTWMSIRDIKEFINKNLFRETNIIQFLDLIEN